MNLLLDTHILLWWLDDNPILKESERAAISNPDNIIIVSSAVIWEIRIKQGIGKLELPSEYFEVIKKQGFEFLPITFEHVYAVGNLPMHHRDPFDRMLISQAKHQKLTIITRDNIIKKYDVKVLS
ncbi:MAG: type II toxin-antitoxin system VapC family toxin [Proteobacteria bacterium]|nr:type II toxin-antitoxin system VapC family toxin [Pseudomonadota bacterium]